MKLDKHIVFSQVILKSNSTQIFQQYVTALFKILDVKLEKSLGMVMDHNVYIPTYVNVLDGASLVYLVMIDSLGGALKMKVLTLDLDDTSLDAVLLKFGNRANQKQPGILLPLSKKRATGFVLFESTITSLFSLSAPQVPVPIPKISENRSSVITRTVALSSVPASELDYGSGSADVIKLPLLTSVDKSNIVAKYANLDVNKLWKLSTTGAVVEKKMRELALKQMHEQDHHSVELPPVPGEVEAYLSELRGLCPRDLYTKVSSEELALNSDVKWVQDAFSQSIRLVQSVFFPVNNITEGGLVKRVWGCLDTCFDFSRITCIRYLQ
ncbi:hypothetical protein PS6_003158 [Mucor atramentarius]